MDAKKAGDNSFGLTEVKVLSSCSIMTDGEHFYPVVNGVVKAITQRGQFTGMPLYATGYSTLAKCESAIARIVVVTQ